MRTAKLTGLVLAAAVAAASCVAVADGVTVQQIAAQLRDSSKCGCAVCPCVEAAPVRTIDGLDKLNEAKAMAALPLGWRPFVRTEACPCPVPAPCTADPCEPAPCPCKKPEFYFADLVDELGAGECTCPEPKPCSSFPCDPVPPCPCRKTVKPEMSDYKVVTGVRCVGPGPCVTPRHFHEPEYTKKLQRETAVRNVVKKLPAGGPTAGGPYVKGQAPTVTEKEAAASYGSESSEGTSASVPQADSAEDSGDQFFSDSESTEEAGGESSSESGSEASSQAGGSAQNPAGSGSGGDGSSEAASGQSSS